MTRREAAIRKHPNRRGGCPLDPIAPTTPPVTVADAMARIEPEIADLRERLADARAVQEAFDALIAVRGGEIVVRGVRRGKVVGPAAKAVRRALRALGRMP